MNAEELVIHLAPREREVLESAADGLVVAEVARELNITEHTVSSYLRSAKQRLYDVRDTAAAVAIAYAVSAIDLPQAPGLKAPPLPAEQCALVPLIAQGMTAHQMSASLAQPVHTVRAAARELLVNLDARNRVHLVKRAWCCQLLTGVQVKAWAERADALRRIEKVLAWDVKSDQLPNCQETASVIKQLVTYGLGATEELRDLCRSFPADSPVYRVARYTLNEADRRLHLPPPRLTPQAMMQRAQNVARLIRALLAAIDQVTSVLATTERGTTSSEP